MFGPSPAPILGRAQLNVEAPHHQFRKKFVEIYISTRHFHIVARGAYVTEPFYHINFYWAGSGWRQPHFYHSIPAQPTISAQPAERTAFHHKRNDVARNHRKGAT